MKKARKITSQGKLRLISVFCLLTLIFTILLSRLFYIMINKSKTYKAMAQSQWTNQMKISPRRGNILDRNGNKLAVTVDEYRIDLDLVTLNQTLKDKNITISELASTLSNILGMKPEDISGIFDKKLDNGDPITSAILKRSVEKSHADEIKSLDLRGIIISPELERYYPNNNLLSQVIGHTDYDGKGITGVEFNYGKELEGISGLKGFEADIAGNQLPYDSFNVNAIHGEDIILTIDQNIQLMAEKAAEKALKDNKAKSVSITIMDPNNGEVLAMTNKPDYNLNSPWEVGTTSEEIQNAWKNNAIQSAFEPGSIFKAITAAAALENNLVDENYRFTCNGSLKVGDKTIYCWQRNGHGEENLVDILKNSCNVGFMELGEKIGKEKLLDFVKKMGFGVKTGIDLPGESTGILSQSSSIGPVELATMSFGQGVAVTQVQYLAAFNAIANGGTLITPHIMKDVVHYEGDTKVIDKKFDQSNEKKVISDNTSTKLRFALEKVVTDGVGKPAFVEGLRIGGKTGTAQKSNSSTGQYESEKYITSFAGMAPVDNPKITMLITINEPDPSKYYAAQTAAPVGKTLFTDIMNYLNTKAP
ncbi:stage V sporulation protein D [Clostridium tunisiense]|uniref:stage V sporulation protein D n=1 Tax=Clostridium tunisiense TaxID=219748 RepID=UPI0006AD04C3|nr:stage V sporulation protein D [Clostridium tunisiense]